MRKIAVVADLHSGHPSGLTPPKWWFQETDDGSLRDRLAKFQRHSWTTYLEAIEAIGPVDVVFGMGDYIDGRETGRLLTSEDRNEQQDMALTALKLWRAPKYVMVYGTRRHGGDLERFETEIARELDGDIGSRAFVRVEDVIFKLRHKVGRSGVPYGRGTAPSRSAIWNELRAAREREAKANVLLFAHVHYYWVTGGLSWTAMTVPALQGESEYGTEEVDDDVDWGIVTFEVDGKHYDWSTDHVRSAIFERQPVLDVLERI